MCITCAKRQDIQLECAGIARNFIFGSECFAHIFPVSNENEHERGYAGLAWNILGVLEKWFSPTFSSVSKTKTSGAPYIQQHNFSLHREINKSLQKIRNQFWTHRDQACNFYWKHFPVKCRLFLPNRHYWQNSLRSIVPCNHAWKS